MFNILKILFGGLLGFGLAKLIESTKTKPQIKCGYLLFVRTEKFDKSYLLFDEYQQADKMYEKIVKDKKVSYKDIVEFDKDEAKLYEKWKSEGNIGKEDYPKLSDTDKVFHIIFEDQNGTALKEKKIK